MSTETTIEQIAEKWSDRYIDSETLSVHGAIEAALIDLSAAHSAERTRLEGEVAELKRKLGWTEDRSEHFSLLAAERWAKERDRLIEIREQDNASAAAEISTLKRQVEEWQWRDIESAPKDGTEIIVFGVPCEHYSTGAPKFQFTYGPIGAARSIEAHFSAGLWQKNNGTVKEVTHWMPLPAHPQSEQKEL